jgi:hypothetical protein
MAFPELLLSTKNVEMDEREEVKHFTNYWLGKKEDSGMSLC